MVTISPFDVFPSRRNLNTLCHLRAINPEEWRRQKQSIELAIFHQEKDRSDIFLIIAMYGRMVRCLDLNLECNRVQDPLSSFNVFSSGSGHDDRIFDAMRKCPNPCSLTHADCYRCFLVTACGQTRSFPGKTCVQDLRDA